MTVQALERRSLKVFAQDIFEDFVENLMKEYEAPGVAVGILYKGKVIYVKGFGYRDLAKKLPVTENTVFGIASVTKSFTALSIQQLAEKGKVFPASPVRQYLAEFDLPRPFWAEKITVHNFLTHTSGIPPLPSLGYGIAASARKKKARRQTNGNQDGSVREAAEKETRSHPQVSTYSELMEFLAGQDYEALGLPGQYLSYSNDCYGLLGAIIEKYSGLSYEDYLLENVFSPLNMKNSTTSVERTSSFSDVTKLYYKDTSDKLKSTCDWQEAPAFTACGFIKSNVPDLLEYLRMYLKGGRAGKKKVASPSSIHSMITPYYPSGRGVWYGYGFTVRPGYGQASAASVAPEPSVSNLPCGVTLAQHSGSLRGVSSNIGFVPEKNMGVVVLCNLTGFPAAKVWLGAVNLLLGLPVDHPLVYAKTMDQPESILRKIEGEYRSGEGGVFEFRLEGQNLLMEVDSKTYPVRMTGPDSAAVTIKAQENYMSFLHDQEGKVWALKYGLRIIRKTR